MIVSELTGTEYHEQYQTLEISNLSRQLDFLKSLVFTAVNLDKKFLSQTIIKALNFHAISCLHDSAGQYRPWDVEVGQHNPPQFFRVNALMDDFVNTVNVNWKDTNPIYLSSYVLWRLIWIHPFINGNGRTARACCYFVLCVKSNGLLPGTTTLPTLMKQNRNQYIEALRYADYGYTTQMDEREFLEPLNQLIRDDLSIQLSSANLS
ncbi:MAG: Fic family protein [Paracoccaceae bacterium]|nr:Fic family protein [Paracoccaceae bacterium]MDE2674611.1 Fic family protein [Paracoccaceae bacterium]